MKEFRVDGKPATWDEYRLAPVQIPGYGASTRCGCCGRRWGEGVRPDVRFRKPPRCRDCRDAGCRTSVGVCLALRNLP